MSLKAPYLAAVAGLALMLAGACSRPPASSAPAEPSSTPVQPAGTDSAAAPASSTTRPAPASATTLTCGGPFGPGTTLESLQAAFGAAAVRQEELNGPEGITFPGLVVHGDDPARRIEVSLTPASAEGPGHGMATVRGGPSNWALASGITVGSGLADVVAANGGPFQLTGLGWDYGGTVTDWQGGRLARDGACQVRIVFGLPDDVGDIDTTILGDTVISSDARGLAAARATVVEASLSWEEPSSSN